ADCHLPVERGVRQSSQKNARAQGPRVSKCDFLISYWLLARPGPCGVGLFTPPPPAAAAPLGVPRPCAAGAPACTPPVPLDCAAPWPDLSIGLADCCTPFDLADLAFFFFLACF